MLEPFNSNGMADQNSEHFQDRECSTWTIRIGLQDAIDNAVTSKALDRAVPMLGAQNLDSAGVARLCRLTKADIFCSLHVGNDERGNGAWRCSHEAMTNRRRLSEQRGLILSVEFV